MLPTSKVEKQVYVVSITVICRILMEEGATYSVLGVLVLPEIPVRIQVALESGIDER